MAAEAHAVPPSAAAPPAAPPSASLRAWAASPAAKAGAILALLLAMQVPLLMVAGLIEEREARRDEVLAGVQRGWGPAQSVLGPTLAVPYTWSAPAERPGAPPQQRRGWVQVPASRLLVAAELAPRTRRRGLFDAVVYTAEVALSGTLGVPEIEVEGAPGAELLWREAVIGFGASDLRGQPAGGTVEVDGRAVPLAVERAGGPCGGVATAPLRLAAAPRPGATIPFQARLVLRGTQSFRLVPWGQEIELRVSAPWRTPGFGGAALPLSYTIAPAGDPAGFRADWQVAGDAVSGGRRTGASVLPFCPGAGDAAETWFGVDLLEAVPIYTMVDRAAKYGTLFLALSFLTYFLFETSTGRRIHLAQYALLGLSVSLFALLLVAVAEPFGFAVAYAVSTAAVMAQASLYTLSVVGSARLAAVFAGVLGLLFGFLYVVLSLETYALLTGTVALFAALSAVMVATRRLRWDERAG